MRILLFGDSTAQGYYDLKTGGWVNLLFIDNLKNRVRRVDNSTEIFNVAISGDTTRRIINRLTVEVESRRWKSEPIALVFAVGLNDVVVSNGKPFSSPQTYHAELEELYTIAQPLAAHIVFVGLESVDENESIPWKFNSGANELVWKNDRIKLFDATLKAFAQEKGVHYVHIFEEFRRQQQLGESLHADGLHPNEKGHQIIFQQVKPVIDKIVGNSNG